MPKLTIATDEPWVYEIFGDEPDVTLGRGAANKVQIAHGTASKHHAALRRIHGHWKLVDLESRNGVRVNGRYRNQHWMKDGDTLHIGDVMVHYAAEGAPDGAPAAFQAQAVPVVPMAPVPTVVATEPTTLEEVPLAPAVAADPAPFVDDAPAAPASPSRAASSRRRDRDGYDDDYDDERPRVRRRDSNAAVIYTVGALAAIAFLFIMFQLVKPGQEVNHTVLIEATRMASSGDLEGAIRHAKAHGDPSEPFYESIARSLASWKLQLEDRPRQQLNSESLNHLEHHIVRKARTSSFRSKEAEPPPEIARRLRELLERYPDSLAARRVIYGEAPPMPELREMMQQNPLDEGQTGFIAQKAIDESQVFARDFQFGRAEQHLTYVRDANQLILEKGRAQEVRRLLDDALASLKREARRAFQEEMRSVDRATKAGSHHVARTILQRIIDTYGLPNLIDEAKQRLKDLQ